MTSIKQTVLITGATSGIGKAITLQLIAKGFNVCFCGKTPEKMNEILKLIADISPDRYFARTFDLLSEADCIRFVRDSEHKFGQIDILINNAGANTHRAKVEDMNTDAFLYMLKLNTLVPSIFMREVVKPMIIRKNGLIINILSTACLFTNEFIGEYSASKAALDSLTKIFRKEVRKDHIRVCSVYPGGTNTPFRSTPRPEYMPPEAVANAVLNVVTSDPNIALDDIVLRPFVEMNF